MPQKNAQDRLWKILTPVLLVLAVLAMAKTLFVGLEIDEEYAFSLGFRLVKGDRLFYTMWEPHQLSALPAALVLALYTAIAGTTTGALLFVRAVVLVCKAAMSAVFYRDFKQTIGRHGALLSAVVLFVYTPKWFLGPDYISQQFHFTVAAFLCFYHYYTHGFRRPWLVVLGAVCACFSFLAFPQSALAAAVIFIGMVLLGRRGKEPTICKIPRGAVLFVLGCMACAAAFLAYVLPSMGLTVFLQRVSLILNDPQYDFTTSQRLALLASQALNTAKFLAKPLATSVVLCLLWWAKTRQKRDWIGLALNLWAILAALLWWNTRPDLFTGYASQTGALLICAGDLIGCAGSAVLAYFARQHFAHALEAQTPFTLRGAAEQKRLGILILCISPATMVLRVALSAAFSAEFMPERLAGMIVADGGMLALGVMFLVLSLVCRYGAEREAMKQE